MSESTAHPGGVNAAATSHARPRPMAAAESGAPAQSASNMPALCIVGKGSRKVWGLETAERLKRQFARQGITETIAVEQAEDHGGRVIMVHAGMVLDQPLIPALIERSDLALTTEPGGRPGRLAAVSIEARHAKTAVIALENADPELLEPLGLTVCPPSRLKAAFWKGLRKREVPYLLDTTTEPADALEWRMFMGTYKGATDFVTKHLWPRPAFYVTRALADTFVTPNMVTTLGAILTVAAFWLFMEGYYITGMVAAWGMTFLDTVDGKLARTTLTSSKWGDVFDHGIDLVHPPFWYYAWGVGLAASGHTWTNEVFWWVLGAIIAGYVLQRVIEGVAIKWLGLEIHIWRPVDTFFRQITARRNPNLAILTVSLLFARPDLGLIAVAIWTVACLALHGLQIAQAFLARRQTGELQSWMSRTSPGQ